MSKTIDEIYGEMLAVFVEASGYLPAPSCDLAARLYAAAAQIQGLQQQARWVLEQCFPQTYDCTWPCISLAGKQTVSEGMVFSPRR